jgi:hypothetical protein
MPIAPRSPKRNPLEAALEVLLGLVVAIAALVPLALIVGGTMDVFDKGLSLREALLVFAGAPVLAWCVHTSWRLLTGRPRKDGGLLSPAVILLAGIGLAAVGAYALTLDGWRALGRAALFVTSGASTVMLAWTRIRRRRPDASETPNTRLHPTAAGGDLSGHG